MDDAAPARDASRPAVLFVSVGSYLGGAQVSLADLLAALDGTVRAVVAVPTDGPLPERLRERRLRRRVDRHPQSP